MDFWFIAVVPMIMRGMDIQSSTYIFEKTEVIFTAYSFCFKVFPLLIAFTVKDSLNTRVTT